MNQQHIEQKEASISVEYHDKKTIIEMSCYDSGIGNSSLMMKLSADDTRKLIKLLELSLGQHTVSCLVL